MNSRYYEVNKQVVVVYLSVTIKLPEIGCKNCEKLTYNKVNL